MNKFLFAKITHTRKVQNLKVMSNNFHVEETYSMYNKMNYICQHYPFYLYTYNIHYVYMCMYTYIMYK